ncbi:hypothetical protein OS493_037872, partial [Desmophyllum pertusum]
EGKDLLERKDHKGNTDRKECREHVTHRDPHVVQLVRTVYRWYQIVLSLQLTFKKGCSTGFHFFEKVQDLPTRGARAVEHCTIDGGLFLAFANYHGDINKHKTSSMIYKMDQTSGQFTLHQTLQTRGAYELEYFSIADKHFLAVANMYDGTYQLDSAVYQWNGQRFVVFQKIPTNGGSHFTFFYDKWRGKVYGSGKPS